MAVREVIVFIPPYHMLQRFGTQKTIMEVKGTELLAIVGLTIAVLMAIAFRVLAKPYQAVLAVSVFMYFHK